KPLSDFDWTLPEYCDRGAIEALMSLEFLEERSNIIFVATNGLGKTIIAKNIAYQAVLNGHSVLISTAGHMLSSPFTIPDHWTPDQAFAIVGARAPIGSPPSDRGNVPPVTRPCPSGGPRAWRRARRSQGMAYRRRGMHWVGATANLDGVCARRLWGLPCRKQ